MKVSTLTGSLIVRPARVPDEVGALLRVANIYDSEPLTVNEFVRLWDGWAPTDPRLRLVAELDGQIVGTSHCRRRSNMMPGLFFIHLYVDREAVGRGIGSVLLRQSEEFAVRNEGSKLTAFALESDKRGQRFAESRSYFWTRTLFESVLRVESVDDAWCESVLANAKKDGSVRFATLAQIGTSEDCLQRMFELQRECDLDEPSMRDVGELGWDDFRRTVLEAAWFRPEGVMLALSGNEWVGVHTLGPLDGSKDADMSTDFTGVRRYFRGKGVALALKVLGIGYAKSLGRTRILTHNDSMNAAMLAVNQKLGFEPRPGWLFMTKELQPEG